MRRFCVLTSSKCKSEITVESDEIDPKKSAVRQRADEVKPYRCKNLIAVLEDDEAQPKSPGQFARHYAPSTPLRLGATSVSPNEALLGFGPAPLGGSKVCANLSPGGDPVEAAANLFAMLHDLDAAGASAIAVMPIPDDGLGAAINDRLRRAAYSE